MELFTRSILPEYRKSTGFRFNPVCTSTGFTGCVYVHPVNPVGRAIRSSVNLQEIARSFKRAFFCTWPFRWAS